MKTNINFHQFQDWFAKNRANNFSRAGLIALWDYLERYEEDMETEIEFDPIALCVEWTEYENMDEFHLEYDAEQYATKDELNDYTEVIEVGSEGFIMQRF